MEDCHYVVIVLVTMIIGSMCIGGCLVDFLHDYNLHQVGIDRIEHCHNVHSNWYEIVWKEMK